MRQFLTSKVLLPLSRIGIDPEDSANLRLQKQLLVASAVGGLVPTCVWGVGYWALNEPVAALLLFIQGLLSLTGLKLFAQRRLTFRQYALAACALIFVMPFLICVLLGGLVNSSLVVAWSVLAPTGALVFAPAQEARRWLLAYAGLVVLTILLQPHLRVSNNLPTWAATIFWILNMLGPTTFFFLVLYYFVVQRDLAFQLLRDEQQKSENLLLNLLPREIAAILKDEQRTIADHFEEASILFADVVNFTPLSVRMTPIELVELLNEVFSHFDAIVERYGLEKIKTIGDCYMVASGVPRPRLDHAQALVAMALEMRDSIASREFLGRRLAFRIGINSGPVVAGVIGRKKFIYDLWGDAVNTASRMESHGAGGVIQITEATYELVNAAFVCEPQGVVQVKGKGPMSVWHVVGERER